jgi:sirohydrochlorin ferrochelatase
MLSPGRHATSDIPAFVAAAARAHPGVSFRVTQSFGIDAALADVILKRAGIGIRSPVDPAVASLCWHPERRTGSCGDACPGETHTKSPARSIGAAR